MINVKIFTFNPLQENSYLIYNENKECVVIDPGCYFQQERDQLKQFIDGNGLRPTHLVNTHCHLDHVFGNKFVAETYGLELYIHPGEKVVLEHAPTSGLMWNLPFDSYVGAVKDLVPGETILLGEDSMKILFVPGHSPASVAFYHEKQGILIAGDVLFRESVGRTDLPGGNPDTLVNSILTQFYILPDETIVYSGHGPQTTIGHEKRNNPYVSI